ncbi:MAG: class III signal peptide-containing protein [Candidatus Micrarchaeia archaeon]
MKGQLSAEMIILLAVVLAVVAIVAIQLTNTAQNASGAVENQSNKILERTGEIAGNFTSKATAPAFYALP